MIEKKGTAQMIFEKFWEHRHAIEEQYRQVKWDAQSGLEPCELEKQNFSKII